MSDAAQAIKEAPTDVLCKAAKTLQEAHDHVEVGAFCINAYGAEGGTCCYIGSVHYVAEERNGPGTTQKPPAMLALKALDKAVVALGHKDYDPKGRHGGVAENYGFQHNDLTPREKKVALGVYRQAIREMQTELMARDDLQKAERKIQKAEKKANKKVLVPA